MKHENLGTNELMIEVTELPPKNTEAPLGVFGIQDIRGKNYQDTGYLRKKVIGIQDIEK